MKSLTQIADQIAVCPVPGGGAGQRPVVAPAKPPTASSRCWQTAAPIYHTACMRALECRPGSIPGLRHRRRAPCHINARSHDLPFNRLCGVSLYRLTEDVAQGSLRVAQPASKPVRIRKTGSRRLDPTSSTHRDPIGGGGLRLFIPGGFFHVQRHVRHRTRRRSTHRAYLPRAGATPEVPHRPCRQLSRSPDAVRKLLSCVSLGTRNGCSRYCFSTTGIAWSRSKSSAAPSTVPGICP